MELSVKPSNLKILRFHNGTVVHIVLNLLSRSLTIKLKAVPLPTCKPHSLNISKKKAKLNWLLQKPRPGLCFFLVDWLKSGTIYCGLASWICGLAFVSIQLQNRAICFLCLTKPHIYSYRPIAIWVNVSTWTYYLYKYFSRISVANYICSYILLYFFFFFEFEEILPSRKYILWTQVSE